MSWKSILDNEFGQGYFQSLSTFLSQEYREKTIFPPKKDVFQAFDLTPPEKVRAVILGMDPYHGKGQAHGLAFSVQKDVPIPPSLRNIFKELKEDIGMEKPEHGNLTSWAKQGVLLLNSALTVRSGEPGSHMGQWEQFTKNIIKVLNDLEHPIAFLLWGNFARKKRPLLTNEKHLVLESGHPSPLSQKLFFGCKHFSQVNEFLKNSGQSEIDWLVK